MPSTTLKRRRTEEQMLRKPAKKVRNVKRRVRYHSSSDEDDEEDNVDGQDFTPANLQDSDEEADTLAKLKDTKGKNAEDLEDPIQEDELSEDNIDLDELVSEAESDSEQSDTSTNASRKKRKRNDPEAFATSMSKILGSKLSTSKRVDPVLSRSKEAAITTQELADAKLEAKARNVLKSEKREALEKGRVRDVLSLDNPNMSTGEILEQEKKLKKTAQRGVIKLFNAVRAAQVKGEEAMRAARSQGVVGIGKREEKVTEMSKKGFLDLIAGGGKTTGAAIEG